VYEQDDREADAIWESIEDKMDERRAVRREKRLEQALRDFRKERPKITQQFADLKRYALPRGGRAYSLFPFRSVRAASAGCGGLRPLGLFAKVGLRRAHLALCGLLVGRSSLAELSADEWDSIPEIGDSANKKAKRPERSTRPSPCRRLIRRMPCCPFGACD
jgi:hypothetical protein